MSKKLSPLFQLRNWILDTHREFTRYFLGRVLTIIDASIADKEQRKGIKNLIEEAFYTSFQKRYPDKEFRYIIIDWADRYCKEISPKEKEDRLAFGAEIEGKRMKYFVEDNADNSRGASNPEETDLA